MTECTLYKQPHVAVQCSGHAANPGIYQIPVDLLLPKRAEASISLSRCVPRRATWRTPQCGWSHSS